MMKKAFLLMIISALPGSGLAQSYEPDSRLRTIDYDPAAVVRLEGCQNFQTMITLASDEHVENVGVGDSAAWQVTPNKRGNLIFVKAIAPKGYTNMSVVSDKRSYSFELRTAPASDCARGQITYELRFRYPPAQSAGTPVNPASPPDPNAFLPVPEKRNAAYTFSGAADLVPIRVFDDGISTYMKWATGVTAPAVYALNSDNTESIVNYASRGDYFVVEQVAPAFVLRRGDEKATLYNDTYAVQGLDSLSPKPRGKNGSAK
ncbi:MAG: TrbG/VirB9 family P-type conjugative transfer protein [Asticcacaulis sp.]|nr:TrbG/VirB9 family P-type conjugative transfer protein [Asticcacaulis sp.]